MTQSSLLSVSVHLLLGTVSALAPAPVSGGAYLCADSDAEIKVSVWLDVYNPASLGIFSCLDFRPWGMAGPDDSALMSHWRSIITESFLRLYPAFRT